MKKFVISILFACTFLCLIFVTACGEKVELVDFSDKTVNIEYGTSYTVESYAYDGSGKSYALSSTVTDVDGDSMELVGGVIVVEKSEYTVTYTADEVKDKPQKTVTIKGYTKPIITVDKTELTVNVDADGYYIPKITAVDGDGEIITDIKKEIYLSEYLGDTLTDYNGIDENYRPEKAGTYFLKIIATDKNGFSNEEKIVFYGKSYGNKPGITITEEYAERVTNAVSGTKGVFVENEDLPNNADYSGDAIKIIFNSANRLYMSMNYSARALTRFSENEYNKVRFNLYFKTDAEYFMINGDQETAENPCFLYKYYKKAQVLETNKWVFLEMSLNDFIEYLGGGQSTNVDLFLLKTWQNSINAEIFIGDLEVFYQAPTLLKTSSQTVGSVIASSTKTFVDNSEIKNIFGDVGEYQGGAIKLNRQGGQAINVTIGLTARQVEDLKNTFSTIKFSFGVVYGTTSWVTANNNANYKDALIVKSGEVILSSAKWYEKTISIDDFIVAMNANDNDENTVFLMMTGAGGTFDLYVGDIEFVL